jgi:ribosomal protein S18 acetylase RimI-like enzyme
LKIINVNWKQTLPIRHKVLWPNESAEFCIVEGDTEALHFAVAIDDQLVCVASIYLDNNKARLRKFATLKEFQGIGIGTYMLKHLIKTLKKHDINYLWFDARETALGFYKGLGFHPTGDRFYKNGIAYYKMDVIL